MILWVSHLTWNTLVVISFKCDNIILFSGYNSLTYSAFIIIWRLLLRINFCEHDSGDTIRFLSVCLVDFSYVKFLLNFFVIDGFSYFLYVSPCSNYIIFILTLSCVIILILFKQILGFMSVLILGSRYFFCLADLY